MRIVDLLNRLVAHGTKPNSFAQGCNHVGAKHHLAHTNGNLLNDLKAIAEEAPELLAELQAVLPKADPAPEVPAAQTEPQTTPEG